MSESQVSYIVSDITEQEFISSLELYINRAYYPNRKCEIGRVSSLNIESRSGSLSVKKIIPFFLVCRSTSFIPSKSHSNILNVHEKQENYNNDGVFFFTPHFNFSSASFEHHNAMFRLSKLFNTWYCVPMVYSRKEFRIMQNMRIMKPLQYGDSSVISDEEGSRRTVLREIPLLRNIMMFTPHAELDKDEFPCSYSISSDGSTVFHGNEDVMETGSAKTFYQFIHDMLRNDASGMSLESYIEQIFEYIPEIFGTSWSSRTLKSVVQQTVDEIVQLDDRAGQSFKHQVEEMGMYEKMVLIEKLLSQNYNITQYLMLFRD